MGDKVRLILLSAIEEDMVEIDVELWAKFEACAKEKGIPVNQLFVAALDAYLKR